MKYMYSKNEEKQNNNGNEKEKKAKILVGQSPMILQRNYGSELDSDLFATLLQMMKSIKMQLTL